ncbi:MAG: phosphoenolpyruvate--protein phosphotransferase [Lysobacterales bacterium]|nr:phosphoenolpyruvate--protein phosphotransferase [Xanthomonadales bacterium]MCP5474699.1 phosphoenolpyruvate--protein phosphotransferase [Rhodanobacteraceae bacterium]
MALILSGQGASRGIGIGRARVLESGGIEIPEYTLDPDHVGAEIDRYRAAVAAARVELTVVAERLGAQVASEVRDFIGTHLMMLEDDALVEAPVEFIRARACNAEWGLKQARDQLFAAFEQMQDDYFRARRDDVDQVVKRIQAALANRSVRSLFADEDALDDTVIVADDIEPAELSGLAERGLAAFIIETGGQLSHSSILARSLGVPCVVGVRGARQMVHEGQLLIVDGDRGFALIDPDGERLTRYRERQYELKRRATQLLRLAGAASLTGDGQAIRLWANAEQPKDLDLALKHGAAGIGLFRTEFLYLNRQTPPEEEEQYLAYVEAVKRMDAHPLTLRTLDIGADKQLPLGQDHDEPNPALGLRGIRLSLKFPELFKTQVRAILRAAIYGPVNMLLPMLGGPGDALQARALIREVEEELSAAGIRYQDHVPVGGMIEVPAAAIAAPRMVEILDFVSIGTNDLIQYTLAIDRGNQAVSRWYQPLHPSVLRLISAVIDTSNALGKPVTLCGEMAGDTRFTALLLALGLCDFSLHPRGILELKETLSRLQRKPLLNLKRRILDAGLPEDVAEILRQAR